MIYCRFCTKQLPEDAIFCNHCGKRQNAGLAEEMRDRTTIQLEQTEQIRPRTTIQFGPNEQVWESAIHEKATDDDMTISRAQYERDLPSRPIEPAPHPFIQPSLPLQYPLSTPLPPTYLSPQQPPVDVMSPTVPVVVPLAQLSKTQRLLIQIFQPTLANNAAVGIILGGIVAIIAGAGLTALLLTIVHIFFPTAAQMSTASSSAGIPTLEQIEYTIGIVPLHVSLRDTLQLFLVIQGVGIHVQYGNVGAAGTSVSSYGYNSPLHGLLVLPALTLTLGGFLAASTDLQNKVRVSLLRGAAIALPYTALLFILATQVNGNIPDSNGLVNTNNGTITMDTLTLLIFGLLWGALFGVLGALLKVAGGQWQRTIYHFLHNNSRPQVIGMTVGAGVASSLGIALSLLVVTCFLAYASLSTPFIQRITCNSAVWQIMTTWGITQSLFHAVNLFAFSFGAPVTLVNQFGQQSACFYTSDPQTTWSLFDSHLALNGWRYLLLLLPLISLFFGGRASVALARSRAVGPAALQGAAIALPFTLFMIFFTTISSLNINNVTGSAGSSTMRTLVESAGVGGFDLLFWALLSGAIFGMLGGIYQVSTFKWQVSTFLSRLATPFVWLCTSCLRLLDRLGRQPTETPYSTARILLCAALLCALLGTVVAGIAGQVLINMTSFYTFSSDQRVRDSISAVIIALPGLLLLSATVAALAKDPYSAQASQLSQQPTMANVAVY